MQLPSFVYICLALWQTHTLANSTPPWYLRIDNVMLLYITQSPRTFYIWRDTFFPTWHRSPTSYPSPSHQQCYATHYHFPTFCAAIGRLPSGQQLQHMQEFMWNQTPADLDSSTPIYDPPPLLNKPLAPMLLSCGLSPVPARLVKRIQDGLFIEMP